MNDLELVYVICFAVMFISCFVAIYMDGNSDLDQPLFVGIVSAFGSGAIVLILWLIEHVRFV